MRGKEEKCRKIRVKEPRVENGRQQTNSGI